MRTLHLVDPAVRGLVSSTGLFDPARAPLEGFRRRLLASSAPPMPEACETRCIPGPPEVAVRIYRPNAGLPPACAIVYVHGGGFIAGTAAMTDALCVQLAHTHHALVVSVDYPLAPEHPFPAPVEACHAALAWLLDASDALGIDPARVLLMGHSAGGGLAAATALLHRDRGGRPLAGQVLVYPMLDARTGTVDAPVDNASTGEFGWTRALNRFAWQALLGDAVLPPERRGHYSPSLAEDLHGLPPTFLAVGALDLFVEEDVAYAMRLSRAGVPLELQVYPGAIHGFDSFPGDNAERFARDLHTAIARLLG